MDLWTLTVFFVAAYFVGNFSPGLVLVRMWGRGDVRNQGSGGTGATNTARALGKNWFYAVLALDMLKAALAVAIPAIAQWAGAGAAGSGTPSGEVFSLHLMCGLAVIIGHIWPVLLGFRGGKGVAPFIGVWIALGAVAWPEHWFAPLTLLAPIAAGLFFLPLKKGAFMSALCALISQPITLWYATGNVAATALALAVVSCIQIAHRSNFKTAFKRNNNNATA
ncbi:MAG: glycerol-3-phosphate acyltransferase [Puniceicoccales bacterium]|jgi:glycerol-3-phosphate acyltransferase PlsY|nr:glycerol-3-phosphate acyltransferase [Puniceicoccales bacterium]